MSVYYVYCVDSYAGFICLLNAADGKLKLDLNIDKNPFNCDCRDYQILSISRFYALSHWLDRTNCEAPPELYNTKVSSFSAV